MGKSLQIQIAVDGTYGDEESKIVAFASRSICHFLEKNLQSFDYKYQISNIVINISKNTYARSAEIFDNPKMLELTIHYQIENFFDLNSMDLNKVFLQILDLGLTFAKEIVSVPYDVCVNILSKFKENDYKNEWIQSEKIYPRLGLTSRVIASLTTEKFFITQTIFEGGEEILKKIIAITKPRENLFDHLLGKLKIVKGGFLIFSKGKCIVTQFNLETREFSIAEF